MANCLVLFSLYRLETPSYMQLSGVLLLAYCPMIIITNALLISSIIATNQSLKNTSNLLIVCLSIADIVLGVIFVPLVGFGNIWFDNPIICASNTAGPILQAFYFVTSSGMTLLLAVDRYLHMNPDFHMSESRVTKLFKRPWIFVLLLVNILLAAAAALNLHFSMINGLEGLINAILSFAIGALIPMALILCERLSADKALRG